MNEKLKAARVARGWTIKQIASFIEAGESSYDAWEKGRSKPSERNIKKLCHLLKKSREELGL